MLELALVASMALSAVVVCMLPFALLWDFLAGLFDLPGGFPDPPESDKGPAPFCGADS